MRDWKQDLLNMRKAWDKVAAGGQRIEKTAADSRGYLFDGLVLARHVLSNPAYQEDCRGKVGEAQGRIERHAAESGITEWVEDSSFSNITFALRVLEVFPDRQQWLASSLSELRRNTPMPPNPDRPEPDQTDGPKCKGCRKRDGIIRDQQQRIEQLESEMAVV